MRILLVGASSTLAAALAPLLMRFAEVTTAGRRHCDVHLDLIDDIEIEPRFDTVINTAAHFGGKDASAAVDAEQVNAVGALKLCAASAASGARHFINISSTFVDLTPSSPFFGPYSLSKRHGDEAVQLFAAHRSLSLATLRPSQIYGVGESFRRHQPFLYTMFDRAQANKDISIYGSNDARRNFIHVEDVARIVSMVAQERVEGTYQCAYPEDVRYSEVAQTAIDAFGGAGRVVFDEDRPAIADNVFPLDDSLYQRLGYVPSTSLAAGFRREAEHRGRAA